MSVTDSLFWPIAANDNSERFRNSPEWTCEHCGVSFRRRKDKKNSCRFCSRACGYAARSSVPSANPLIDRELRKWADSQSVSFRVARCVCRVCDRRFSCITRSTSYCSDECRRVAFWERRGVDASDRVCAQCCRTYKVEYGRAHAKYCSDDCAKIATRRSPSARAAKARRKAIERGAAGNDNVDPIAVFDRDKWRCQLCGVKTPKKLRGTYKPNAPELDHIKPISLGGDHSYVNTQCACRSCNSAKGAAFIGQMRLFG